MDPYLEKGTVLEVFVVPPCPPGGPVGSIPLHVVSMKRSGSTGVK